MGPCNALEGFNLPQRQVVLDIVATKTAHYASQEQDDYVINKWTENSNHKSDMFPREGKKTTVWDLGILLPPLCLPWEACIWKVFLSIALCMDLI